VLRFAGEDTAKVLCRYKSQGHYERPVCLVAETSIAILDHQDNKRQRIPNNQ